VLPLAYARAWVAASALIVAGLLYASLAPSSLPPGNSHLDKVGHAVAYVFLSVWFAGLVARSHYWKVVVGLTALGLLVEGLQQGMGLGRQGDALDVAANLVGIAAGMALATWMTGGWAQRVEAWLNRS
jgi:VanZ family protein